MIVVETSGRVDGDVMLMEDSNDGSDEDDINGTVFIMLPLLSLFII